MPSKEQYYVSCLAKYIVQNIKAQTNRTSVGEARTLKASAKTTKPAEGTLNSSSKIWLQDTFWRLYSAYRGIQMSFPWDTHTMKSLDGGSMGSSSQAAKVSPSLGGRARTCQIPELSAVPAGGARGRMSRRQHQLKRVRGTERTSSSGLWQPHVASFIPTCCSNGSSLKLLASLLWFHEPNLDTHVVYLNPLNHIYIFLGKKKQGNPNRAIYNPWTCNLSRLIFFDSSQ